MLSDTLYLENIEEYVQDESKIVSHCYVYCMLYIRYDPNSHS